MRYHVKRMGFALVFSILLLLPSRGSYGQEGEDVQRQLEELGRTIEQTIRTNIEEIRRRFRESPIGEAFVRLIEELHGAGEEWTEDLWQRVQRIAEETGVMLDEFVPSISGCIRDEKGEPMYGVAVFALPLGIIDIAVPTWAITGGGTVEEHPGNPSLAYIGGVPVPVSGSFVPDEYEEEFNRGGCYWVPLSPGVIQMLTAIRIGAPTEGTSWDILVKIVPIMPGYKMEPFGKEVFIKRSGEFYIQDIENLTDIGGELTSGESL